MRTATKTWFRAAGIRAVKTLAQTAVAMIGVGATIGSVNWLEVSSAAAVSAILSLLTSLAGLPEIKDEQISFASITKVKEDMDEKGN